MEKPTIDLIFQVALCVDDLESVVEQWKELFDLDTATIVRKCTKDAYESDGWDGLNYNEAPCQFFHKYCRFSLGGLDIEIIEPLDKAPGNPYSDFLIQHGNGIHHIGVKVGGQKFLMRRCRNGASRAITTRRWGLSWQMGPGRAAHSMTCAGSSASFWSAAALWLALWLVIRWLAIRRTLSATD